MSLRHPGACATAVLLLAALVGCTAETPPVASDPQASPTPRTLLTDSGTGPGTTDAFEADAAWDLAYSYDCSDAGSDFLLQVQRVGQPVNVLAEVADAKGQSGERSARWPHGGSYSLRVTTPCDWSVRVVEG